jgi:hypothetical protein
MREHLPPKNSKRAELVLELPSRHPGIQVPNVQAGHRSRSPTNHPPPKRHRDQSDLREASEKFQIDGIAKQNQTTNRSNPTKKTSDLQLENKTSRGI